CCICSHVFFGRQPRLVCSKCGHRVHERCLMFAADELQLLSSGVRAFVCSHCDDSSASNPNGDGTRPADQYEYDTDEGGLDPPGVPGGMLHGLLLDALEGISFLTDQVASLTGENKRLRNEWTRVSERQAVLVGSLRDEVKAYRAEVAGWRAASTVVPRQAAAPYAAALGASPLPSLRPSPPPRIPVGPRTGAVHDGTPVMLGSMPPPVEGAQTKRPTRPRPTVSGSVGASSSSRLSVVSAAPRPRAMFVTKLAPTTTSSDMVEHLVSVGAAPLICRKLKTRYDSYSSFYVAVDDATYETLRDPSFWLKSCLFKPFRGGLRDELLHDCELL
ncbi:unnamed protein product, partial [Ixodes hexagonus]